MAERSYTDEILERSRKDSRLGPGEFGRTPYEMYCVPLEIYEKYRDQVLRLSLSYQKWVAPGDGSVLLERVDQLSDREIAVKLGLDEDTVMRIRCMTEWDMPMEVWRNSAEFKRRHRLEKPMGASVRTIKNEPS